MIRLDAASAGAVATRKQQFQFLLDLDVAERGLVAAVELTNEGEAEVTFWADAAGRPTLEPKSIAIVWDGLFPREATVRERVPCPYVPEWWPLGERGN